MKFEKFSKGKHFTLGLELELRILSRLDLIPSNEYDYILSNISEKYKKNLSSEFLASMIEINTPIFYENKKLINFLKEIINELKKVAKNKNLYLQANGCLAQKHRNIKINPKNRYEKLHKEHQILLDNFSICGTHIHVGFENFNKALIAFNYSIYYLPLFVALSASSLFYNNKNTGIHSYRTKIFDRLPKSSLPEYFDSFEEMQYVYELLEKSNIIDSTKDIWWDLRIQSKLKTLEFRICDSINDFDRLEVMIDLLKAICKLSQIEEPVKLPMQVLKQNMWSATRDSMDGKMVTTNGLKSIRNIFTSLLKKIEMHSLLSKKSIIKAKEIIAKKSISLEMLEIYEKTKSFKKIDKLGVFK